MCVTLINPNLVVQRSDPFTTGIVYMPITLAYVAASLRAADLPVRVVDAFAEKPYEARKKGKFLLLGLTDEEVIRGISEDTKIVFVYAINLTNHISTVGVVKSVKLSRPDVCVVVLENMQAVTAYALCLVAKDFYDAGADYILTGECELSSVKFVREYTNGINGSGLKAIEGLGSPDFYKPPVNRIKDLDSLPFPAWDLFPLRNYWKLRFGHGPVTTKQYLPLLTSRGCPYACRFCVSPFTNNRKWLSRSAKNVVDEIEHYINEYGVTEFHIEDLNPTVSDQRTRDICNEIIKRNLKIIWKIAAGTKVETIENEDTIDLMAKAGCTYISISPETGSGRVLELMNKPFDLEHAVLLIGKMNLSGIRSQGCFVIGFPGETDNDRKMTWNMVRELTHKGLDEIALFIVTPVPGSAIYNDFCGYAGLSDLNFSPVWRDDYNKLNLFRISLYKHFLYWKFKKYPFKIVRQALNFVRRRFETKMEMVPFRAMVFKFLELKSKN